MTDTHEHAGAGHVAVIFISTRTDDHADDYQVTAASMDLLARQQPGFMDVHSVRDPSTRQGITVSIWEDEASAQAWKQVAAHLQAQRAGIDRFYQDYEVIVAQVSRRYGFSR
jgi:heme-degrading monooxygenase HmoA